MAFERFYSDVSNRARDLVMIGRDDKRNFIRMNIDAHIIFNRTNSTGQHSAKAKDLSATGLRFITDAAVDIGEKLEVAIHPGTDLTPPLMATMTVVRVFQDEESNNYDVAGLITERHV
jgi:hypothetical protein